MGPEDDRKREVRAYLADTGTASTSQIANALQLDPDRVGNVLEEMEEAESLGGSRDGKLWRLRKNPNLDSTSVNRFMSGLSP